MLKSADRFCAKKSIISTYKSNIDNLRGQVKFEKKDGKKLIQKLIKVDRSYVIAKILCSILEYFKFNKKCM